MAMVWVKDPIRSIDLDIQIPIMDSITLTNSDSEAANDKLKSPMRSETSSPESSCAICLGKLENNSFTDSCFHTFCFVCLLEWSKVRAVCPLCQQPFRSIIHNVRSIEDYDQYHLRATEYDSWESANGQRFRYRTTMTTRSRHALLMNLNDQSRRLAPLRERQIRRAATSEFRRNVYNNNLWVRGWGETQQIRYRNISPEFFRSNPACTHRLIPWLNRELNVLLYNVENHVSLMLELIMAMLIRYEITGQEFLEHVRPYLQNRTEHFVHEFVTFARSPYDMTSYDNHAVYDESSEVDDNDIIILTPNQNSEPTHIVSPQPSTSWATESITSADSNEIFVDSEDSDSLSNLNHVQDFLNTAEPGRSGWEPPLEINLETSLGTSSDSDNEDSLSTSSNIENLIISKVKSDDCIIVGYVKPRRERTPQVVDLVSSSSDESQDNTSSYGQSPQPGGSRKAKESFCSNPNHSQYYKMDSPKDSCLNYSSSDSSRTNHPSSRRCSKSSSKERSHSSCSKLHHKKSKSERDKDLALDSSSSRVHKYHKKKHKKHKKKHKHHSLMVNCKKHHKGHKNSSSSTNR